MHKRLLLISFDAVGNDELDKLNKLPNFKKYCASGKIWAPMTTIFNSNTYPIHASISTGKVPGEHGLYSNTVPEFDTSDRQWNYDSRLLKGQTIWQYAHSLGVKVASSFWPVTCFDKCIDYHIPEAMSRKNESQLLLNLRAGSKFLQLKEFLRHRHFLDGIKQPNLDNFSRACMCDMLRETDARFAMMHLTCYDTLCHLHGKGSKEADFALTHLDESLGLLAEAAGEDTKIIVFSDHSQLNVEKNLHLNKILNLDESGYFHYTGGSAFFIDNGIDSQKIEQIKKQVLSTKGVGRLLTDSEMKEAGYPADLCPFGVCGKVGYAFDSHDHEVATHGYPVDYENFGTFCAINDPDEKMQLSSILDINTLVKQQLRLMR